MTTESLQQNERVGDGEFHVGESPDSRYRLAHASSVARGIGSANRLATGRDSPRFVKPENRGNARRFGERIRGSVRGSVRSEAPVSLRRTRPRCAIVAGD
jgi:hypothetical protein